MKKKGILIIIFSIALTIVLTLIINNFLSEKNKIKNLVCEQYLQEEFYKSKKTVIISFNSNGYTKEIIQEDEIIYNDEQMAKIEFEQFKKSLGEDWQKNIKLNNKTINLNYNSIISEEMKEMTRKQVINKYKEFGYECK